MANSPRISIITPTYNAARYLEQTMASVAAQEYPALEYIVVDGGSTDATLDMVRDRPELVTRWISEPDKGISDAFNKGISMATGEIVGIINSDDYYHPGALAVVARAACEHPEADVFYGDALYERFDGSGVFRFRPDPNVGHNIERRMPICHPATFVRLTAYQRYGVFDLRYRLAMDYELLFRMFRAGARFQYVNQVLSHFRYGQPGRADGLREVKDIAIANGVPAFVAWIRYGEALIKERIRLLLARSAA